jgi:catechol 2,3-dioxygenase-like lactoylglutathione lyase family enzyme
LTRQVDGPLVVVEEADRVLVAPADDRADWLCAFAKADGFPARRWAQDMVRTYNARLESEGQRRAILPTAVSGRINHVSVNARDLKASVDFYVELLGAELLPTPNFGLPVQWLALGRTQLHLFERDLQPTSHHHLGITVDDLEPVYRVAERRGAFDREAFGNHLVELPGDVVQLYLRDPAGNLVEIDHHGADRLPDDLRAELKGLWDFNPQDAEQMSARLFVPR